MDVHGLHGLHVHAPSPSCRMSYCDPIYFLSESANTTNLYMYCHKSCLATYCPMCVYCGCVVHVCIVLCILHCPSVAMHSPPPPPPPHTHFIPLCHMPCPTECPGTLPDNPYAQVQVKFLQISRNCSVLSKDHITLSTSSICCRNTTNCTHNFV